MRPLPSPLAQLSSRYNIVVYSEPRLRSVNRPSAPCPRWLYRQQPTLRSPNLPDAAARISRSLSRFLSLSFHVSRRFSFHAISSSPSVPFAVSPTTPLFSLVRTVSPTYSISAKYETNKPLPGDRRKRNSVLFVPAEPPLIGIRVLISTYFDARSRTS